MVTPVKYECDTTDLTNIIEEVERITLKTIKTHHNQSKRHVTI